MKDPRVSSNGNCPSCASDNWKLAKVIVASGTSIVDTESEGGGWGVGAGAGRGHGGVGVNYQGMNLSTTGTYTTAEALAYAPPEAPSQYSQKLQLLSKCGLAIGNSRRSREEVDKLAPNFDSIKPQIFGGITDATFKEFRSEYTEYVSILQTIENYEIQMALWEKMRVCCRCGESFVTPQDKQLASKNKIQIPEFSFEGEDRRCPSCMSYIWKTADAFFDIKIRQKQENCDLAKKSLTKAIDYSNNPTEGGFFKKHWNKIFTPTPEKAQMRVDDMQSQLANMLQKRKEVLEQFQSLEKVRVCTECESPYILNAESHPE